MDRQIKRLLTSRPTVEGAGVRLHRVFGYDDLPLFDPFLLLDDFSSDRPQDYAAGFPWHPHRGIETVTYVLRGEVEHGDSIGNNGVIGPGDVQWMTAGSGIIHQEMPKRARGGLAGFQLWVNLPAKSKMMPPRYRDVRADTIPELEPAGGVKVRAIAGAVAGVRGPVRDIVVETEYLEARLEPGAEFVHPVPRGHRAFIYVFGGAVAGVGAQVERGQVALLGEGDQVRLRAEASSQLLLISGEPLNEPVAWRGPIVMNTENELDVAFDEYDRGTFVRRGRSLEE